MVDVIRVAKARSSRLINFVNILLLTFFADILVHTVKLKPFIKAQISGKLITSGINYVVTASVHSEKTRLKKMIMIIIIISMNQ